MMAIIDLNMVEIGKLFEDDFNSKILNDLKNLHSMDNDNHFYLSTYRSIQAAVSCVYGVIKDT
ncbi:MAG: hypothetical protein ACI8RD_011396 [Bacillariaceae sp.]|jgi:hypothetical protein